jgi:uncharacterized membrane protein
MPEKVNARLETFCDGVFAIAITLLILEVKIPPLESIHSTGDLWQAVENLWPSFFALCWSFIIIFIAWIGHHNLLKIIDKSTPQFQFANAFFMFTIIFIPFPTSFMAEYLNTPFAQPAIEVYCLMSLLHNLGWIVFNRSCAKPVLLVKEPKHLEILARITRDGRYAFFVYVALCILAIWQPYPALIINLLIWIYWLFATINLKEKKQAKEALAM